MDASVNQKPEIKKQMGDDQKKTFDIVMYPWFAMGHLTPFLHLSNKLAERGHRISFILPARTLPKLEQFNVHPKLITFIPITVPEVEGLPPGSETTAEIPFSLQPLLRHAMDLTRPTIELLLLQLRPHFVFFDFTHWLPSLATRLGIRSLHYCIISAASVSYLLREEQRSLADLMQPPPGFPPSSIKLRTHEARGLLGANVPEPGSNISFLQRLFTSFHECDAIGFKTCAEMEGPYCEYLENKFKKPVILAGPVLPEPPTSTLDEKWKNWLDSFKPGKPVIFCAFGSECRLKKDQFQELVLGFEQTGLPFIAALKPPIGAETVELALPEGFKERTKDRGIVHGGWVQQQLILSHPSVGCFVTHCGSGSLSEALVNDCQLVLVPHAGEMFISARVMGGDLRVGVEVEKGDSDGSFTKEGVFKAINVVMDEESQVGKEVRTNHAKWKEFLLSQGLETSYIDSFVRRLQELLN